MRHGRGSWRQTISGTPAWPVVGRHRRLRLTANSPIVLSTSVGTWRRINKTAHTCYEGGGYEEGVNGQTGLVLTSLLTTHISISSPICRSEPEEALGASGNKASTPLRHTAQIAPAVVGIQTRNGEKAICGTVSQDNMQGADSGVAKAHWHLWDQF